jgi:hypothetical protein
MVHGSRIRMASALLVLGLAWSAHADDPMIEGARLCTQQFPVQESAKGIPTHLLAAISSTESGRWNKKLGMALPWPWTTNVEGKGYYYDSKAEAVAATRAHLAAGARSIDIGCMQVNLKHHPNAFRSLEEAFDPAANVAYSATFLRNNYEEMGDWIKATAAYHSRTNKRGQAYLSRIEQSWNRIVSKVAAARQRQGLPAVEAAEPDFSVAAPPPASQRNPMRPIDSTRNVRIIQVSEQQRPASSDVLVIRTSETLPAAQVSSAGPSDMMVKGAGDTIRPVRIDNGAGSSNMGDNPTTFVFAN